MSKILVAQADATGRVTVEGVPLLPAQIISEGKQSSTGIVAIEGEKIFYITSNASDIKTTIEKLISAIDALAPSLTSVATSLTALGAVPSGSWAPPPVLATSAADLTVQVATLNTVKAELTALKAALK